MYLKFHLLKVIFKELLEFNSLLDLHITYHLFKSEETVCNTT